MEFATHCIEKDVDIIIFPTNWTDDKPNDLNDIKPYTSYYNKGEQFEFIKFSQKIKMLLLYGIRRKDI
jgi:hypothetical protein